jgi:integrase/recombinase XerD
MEDKDLLNLFQRYLSLERNMSINTSLSYYRDVRLFLIYCRENGIDPLKIEPEIFENYLWQLKKNRLKTASLFRKTESIKSFYKFLLLENIISKNPFSNFKAPKLEKRLPKTLSLEEIDKLLSLEEFNEFNNMRTMAAIELLYASGIRISELATLRLESMNLSLGWIRVIGKGSKERLVPINEGAIKIMERYLDFRNLKFQNKDVDSFVFLNKFGRRISRIQLWKDIKKMAKKAGIEKNIYPHLLRHSFATHLLQRGADLMSIGEMLGHSSLNTTQIYTHLDNSALKSMHKKFHPKG